MSASFNPSADAAALRKAMKGLGTTTSTLTNIIANRTNDELCTIVKTYSKEIERDLRKDLKSETSGDYETLLTGLIEPFAGYCAEIVYESISGVGTDENHLIEIICLRSPSELLAISKVYREAYGKDMNVHVKTDCGGHLGQCLSELIRYAILNEGKAMPTPPDSQIDDDVQALYNAGEGNQSGTDLATYVEIFCRSNRQYLERVNQAYARKHGRRLDIVLKNQTTGFLRQALTYRIVSAPDLFAERFYGGMHAITTNQPRMTRIVISNKMSYLPEINQSFLAKYGKTMVAAVQDHPLMTKYKDLLLATLTRFGDIGIAEARVAVREAEAKAMEESKAAEAAAVVAAQQAQEAEEARRKAEEEAEAKRKAEEEAAAAEAKRIQDERDAEAKRIADEDAAAKAAEEKNINDAKLEDQCKLNHGERITSRNGKYYATMQNDGNFVVYDAAGKALWATNTDKTAALYVVNDAKDCNIYLKDMGDQILWSSKTQGPKLYQGYTEGNGTCVLHMQDNGDLTLMSGSKLIWHSDTIGGQKSAFFGAGELGDSYMIKQEALKAAAAVADGAKKLAGKFKSFF